MLFSRIITASVLCLATQFAQAQITIKAWVTIKDNVTNAFPVYSTEQKDFVAGQVQQMLSVSSYLFVWCRLDG